MDAQQKEINSYREALKRMGEEIVRMQEQVRGFLSNLNIFTKHL